MDRVFETSNACYRIERELGAGRTGVTYLVRRAADDARFVLKELRVEHMRDWKTLELFEREVAALRALEHPGIPAYVDAIVDRDTGRFALVQDYIEGRTLAELLRARATVDAADFERYLRQCLEVLAYLHARVPAVIHRDLQPRNIMVDDARAYLIDFGAVRLHVGESTTMTSVGTFGYMAPEQLRGRATPASDLYGLGMSFIALAAGRDAASLPEDPKSGLVDRDKLREQLTLPERLRALLLDMIEPGVAARVATAADALRRLDAPAPAPARPRARGFLGDARRAALACSSLLALGLGTAWSLDQVAEEGELRTLGGWTSGHGSPVADVMTSVLGDAYGTNNLWIHAIAFSPDGTRLASSANDGVIIWSVADGTELAFAERERFQPEYRALRYTPQGDAIVGVNWRGDVEFLDPETGALTRRHAAERTIQQTLDRGHTRAEALWVGDRAHVRLAAFFERALDGEGYEKHLLVVDPIAGELLGDRPTTWDNTEDAGFSGDGRRVGFVGYERAPNDRDPRRHRALAWDLESGRVLVDDETVSEQSQVALDETGARMLSLGYDGVTRWTLDTGARLSTLGTDGGGYDTHLVLGPARRFAYTTYEGIRVCEHDMGDCAARFTCSRGRALSLAFSPDGTLLASGGADQRVRLWSVP